MRGSHRHPARVSAALLPNEIRRPKVMPSYLDDLLKELDDRLGSDQVEGSRDSKRPANR
jgi:hypothetical protein